VLEYVACNDELEAAVQHVGDVENVALAPRLRPPFRAGSWASGGRTCGRGGQRPLSMCDAARGVPQRVATGTRASA